MLDLLVAALGLILTSWLLLPVMFLIWCQDGHSPLYRAPRVGRGGRLFMMVKLRSMVVDADRTGVDSTGADDARITSIGRCVRRFKLDELTQLWNVLKGDMSLVGPRPNVARETALYTLEEKALLSVRPGITDFASIVFADEGEILAGRENPDLAYNQLIRPGKSQLGLFYIEKASLALDLRLIGLTALAIVSRPAALLRLNALLRSLGAGEDLLEIAAREKPLRAIPPPGAAEIVRSRDAPPASASS